MSEVLAQLEKIGSSGGQWQYVIQRGNPSATITLDHDTSMIMVCATRQEAYDRHTVYVDGVQQTLTSLGNIGQGYAGWGLSVKTANGNYKKGQIITIYGGDAYSSDLSNYGAMVIA